MNTDKYKSHSRAKSLAFLFVAMVLVACGGSSDPTDKLVLACTQAGTDEDTCICQANAVAKQRTKNELEQLAFSSTLILGEMNKVSRKECGNSKQLIEVCVSKGQSQAACECISTAMDTAFGGSNAEKIRMHVIKDEDDEASKLMTDLSYGNGSLTYFSELAGKCPS